MENNLLHLAEVEVIYKQNYKIIERPKITKAYDAYVLFFRNWNKGKISYLEEFKVMLLNRDNRVLGIVDVSLGGATGTVVDPKIIFAIALKGNASAIILCHNHPSGNLKTSEADRRITEQLKSGGKLLEIEVHDHLIINSDDGYLSFADEGLM